MGRPVIPEKRIWVSEATLPIKAQIQLKLSVLLNLTYYAETSIQESLSWTKKKTKTKPNRDFLFAKENEIVKIALETTEVSKPKLARKALLTEVLHEAGTA